MDNSRFRGLGVAMVTPFKENGAVDFDALKEVTKHISKGADYLVVLGTTAETPTLTDEESGEVLDVIVSVNNKKLPIMLGVGGNCTRSVVEKIKAVDSSKVDAILSVQPYYNRPTQEGQYQHFAAIAKATKIPVMLYNIPGRTGVNMEAQTTVRLAKEFDAIFGIKEASGNLDQMEHIIKTSPDDFLVVSGDDALAIPLISLGGDGLISVIGNAFPVEMSELIHSALKGSFVNAKKIHDTLLGFFDLLFLDGNPAGIKGLMTYMGLLENNLRLPLVPATENTLARLKERWEAFK